jgi:hypothetical protein
LDVVRRGAAGRREPRFDDAARRAARDVTSSQALELDAGAARRRVHGGARAPANF